MAPALAALTIAAEPDAWRRLGFTVDGDGTCRIGTVACRLVGGGRHIRAWSLEGLDDPAVDDIDGLGLVPGSPAAEAAEHDNGVADIDHVVVTTPDLGRTVGALEAQGFETRRYRDAGGGMQQAFYRLGGPVILEVVGPPSPAGDGPARFFGLACNVADLDATAAFYGDASGRVKDAVQPGRRIMTLHDDGSAATKLAFMSPGPHSIALIEAGTR